MAPGTRALAFASRWFEPSLVHRTFEPLIADWQREWHDSAPDRRLWVSIRAWAAFICSVAVSSPSVIATDIPRSISRRVFTRIALFCFVIAGALCIPMLRSMGSQQMDPPLWASLLLMVMPAALSITFPFAMVSAVDTIRRDDAPPHVARAAALKLGAVAVCFMLAMGGFVGPYASRQFVRVTTPSGWNIPEPRIQQLSTVALLNHPDRSGEIVPGQYTRAGIIRRELLNRSLLSIIPILFIWLRWSALSRPRRHRFWPLPASAMTVAVIVIFYLAFFGGFTLENRLKMPVGTAAVVPPVAIAAWALAEQRCARRTRRGPSVAHEA